MLHTKTLEGLEHIELFNIEQEQILLGYLLSENNLRAMPKVNFLQAGDFYDQTHQQLWLEVLDFTNRGIAINPVMLSQKYQSMDKLGGKTYIMRLVGHYSDALNYRCMAENIRDLAKRREAVVKMHHALQNLYDFDKPAEETLGAANADFLKLADSGHRGDLITSKELAMQVGNSFDRELLCNPTGLNLLDEAMGGGLYAERSYCIAARPKNGKTTMLCTISQNLNDGGVKHLFIAAEMGMEQIHQRNIARKINRNSIAFLTNRKDPNFTHRVRKYAAQEEAGNTIYANKPGISFNELKRVIATCIAAKGIKGVILDYLQLVTGRPRGTNESEWQAEVAQWIAAYCREHGIWCLYAAQLNRDNEVRGSDGIRMAVDQLYRLSLNDEAYAHMDMLASRYTEFIHIGSEDFPALELKDCGPYFEVRNA